MIKRILSSLLVLTASASVFFSVDTFASSGGKVPLDVVFRSVCPISDASDALIQEYPTARICIPDDMKYSARRGDHYRSLVRNVFDVTNPKTRPEGLESSIFNRALTENKAVYFPKWSSAGSSTAKSTELKGLNDLPKTTDSERKFYMTPDDIKEIMQNVHLYVRFNDPDSSNTTGTTLLEINLSNKVELERLLKVDRVNEEIFQCARLVMLKYRTKNVGVSIPDNKGLVLKYQSRVSIVAKQLPVFHQYDKSSISRRRDNVFYTSVSAMPAWPNFSKDSAVAQERILSGKYAHISSDFEDQLCNEYGECLATQILSAEAIGLDHISLVVPSIFLSGLTSNKKSKALKAFIHAAANTLSLFPNFKIYLGNCNDEMKRNYEMYVSEHDLGIELVNRLCVVRDLDMVYAGHIIDGCDSLFSLAPSPTSATGNTCFDNTSDGAGEQLFTRLAPIAVAAFHLNLNPYLNERVRSCLVSEPSSLVKKADMASSSAKKPDSSSSSTTKSGAKPESTSSSLPVTKTTEKSTSKPTSASSSLTEPSVKPGTKISKSGTYDFAGQRGTIEITTNDGEVILNLHDVSIDVSKTPNLAAIRVVGNCKVTVHFYGNCILKSGENCAGLQKDGSGILEVHSNDSVNVLTAIGGCCAAGIGGGNRQDVEHILISGGGHVIAKGGAVRKVQRKDAKGNPMVDAKGNPMMSTWDPECTGGAGVGGGNYGSACDIQIMADATVEATEGHWAAGIGSGRAGKAGKISVLGAFCVTAKGGFRGAGIGAGRGGQCLGPIEISASKVVATGMGRNASGIGHGDDGKTDDSAILKLLRSNITAEAGKGEMINGKFVSGGLGVSCKVENLDSELNEINH